MKTYNISVNVTDEKGVQHNLNVQVTAANLNDALTQAVDKLKDAA